MIISVKYFVVQVKKLKKITFAENEK